MKIAIMGAGGVGGYLGARLAEAGHDVAFIARGAHLEAMRARGLRLDDPEHPVHLKPVRATDDPSQIGAVDLVVFAVKIYDARGAAQLVRPLIGGETAVLDLLNGVESHEWLAETLGREHVMRGAVYISAHVAEPGVIAHQTPGVRLVFGDLDGGATPRAEAVRDALAAIGVAAEVTPDVPAALWSKMVMLAAISGVCCLARLPIRDVTAEPEGAALIRRAMDEVVAVAAARGIAVETPAAPRGRPSGAANAPAIKPSMLQDLERGKPLEVEWLSGAVARFGQAAGVPTPIHDTILAALKPWAKGRPARP